MLATLVEGDTKVPFSIATLSRCKGGSYSFRGLLHFTLNADIIMLNVKQGGIKYYFLSLCYDSTKDWTPEPWVNDLLIRPMARLHILYIITRLNYSN